MRRCWRRAAQPVRKRAESTTYREHSVAVPGACGTWPTAAKPRAPAPDTISVGRRSRGSSFPGARRSTPSEGCRLVAPSRRSYGVSRRSSAAARALTRLSPGSAPAALAYAEYSARYLRAASPIPAQSRLLGPARLHPSLLRPCMPVNRRRGGNHSGTRPARPPGAPVWLKGPMCKAVVTLFGCPHLIASENFACYATQCCSSFFHWSIYSICPLLISVNGC